MASDELTQQDRQAIIDLLQRVATGCRSNPDVPLMTVAAQAVGPVVMDEGSAIRITRALKLMRLEIFAHSGGCSCEWPTDVPVSTDPAVASAARTAAETLLHHLLATSHDIRQIYKRQNWRQLTHFEPPPDDHPAADTHAHLGSE